MSRRLAALTAALCATVLLSASAAQAQVTLLESGFRCHVLSADLAKQVEIGTGSGPGADTCIYYGSFDGLKRRCGPFDPGTICDPNLTFPVGIAFSTGGSFGSATYVADWGLGDVWRMTGCGTATSFATLPGPGSLAFPPSGSAYGDFLYSCAAFDGPIYRISSAGVVTSWLDLETAYLRFGPGGAWGTGMYATDLTNVGNAGIDRVSSAGVVTPLVSGLFVPEGFDWGFDGDMFATDMGAGVIYRVKPNGTKTQFATLGGAADIAYRAGEQALYVVSNQGGFYRISYGSETGVADGLNLEMPLVVSPNPARGACRLSFAAPAAGLARAQVVDVSGRRVRLLSAAWRPAGTQSLDWDGLDESGVRVSPGTYFARVQVADWSSTARVTVVQ